LHIPSRKAFTIDEEALRSRVQDLMARYGSVVREEAGLKTALQEIRAIRTELEQGFDDRRVYIELLNIVTVAEAILEGALSRRESIGAHYWKEGVSR